MALHQGAYTSIYELIRAYTSIYEHIRALEASLGDLGVQQRVQTTRMAENEFLCLLTASS
jgi:hypothetical protein